MQAGELAAQDGVGVAALLIAEEPGEVACQEGGKIPGTGRDVLGRDSRLLQQFLGSRVLQDGGHADLHEAILKAILAGRQTRG